MNTERILIYKDQDGLARADVNYKEVQRRLQIVLNAVKAQGTIPTFQALRGAIFNNNWTAIYEELIKPLEGQHVTLAEYAQNKIIESLNKIQNKEALSLQKYWSEMIVIPDLDRYYSIDGCTVVLDPSYKEALEEHFSVYADSEGRKTVLEAFNKAKEAVEELERAVKAAPKRDLTQEERLIKAGKYSCGARIFPDDLGGLRPLGIFAIAAIDPDGEMILKRANFSNLK